MDLEFWCDPDGFARNNYQQQQAVHDIKSSCHSLVFNKAINSNGHLETFCAFGRFRMCDQRQGSKLFMLAWMPVNSIDNLPRGAFMPISNQPFTFCIVLTKQKKKIHESFLDIEMALVIKIVSHGR